MVSGIRFRVDILVHVSLSDRLHAYDRFVVAFPAKLVAASSLMRFWVPASQVNPAVWISVYAVLPIAFNMFNVRRYGEIEFWLSTLKVLTCVGLIILGLLLAMGASTESALLGTNSDNGLIACVNATIDNCVSAPGFNCISFAIHV